MITFFLLSYLNFRSHFPYYLIFIFDHIFLTIISIFSITFFLSSYLQFRSHFYSHLYVKMNENGLTCFFSFHQAISNFISAYLTSPYLILFFLLFFSIPHLFSSYFDIFFSEKYLQSFEDDDEDQDLNILKGTYCTYCTSLFCYEIKIINVLLLIII